LWCFPGITPVVPGRAKDEAGKAIPSRIIPDHPGDIKYFIPSGVECRMFPDSDLCHFQSFFVTINYDTINGTQLMGNIKQ
jgi:hypothetical protein